MKTLSLLFSIYVLVLAIYPCMDEETCLDEKRKGVNVSSTTDHEHSSSESDHCSPFCICSCCATTVQLTVPEVIIPPRFFHNTYFIIPYREIAILNSSYPIWQPPKLA